MKLQATQNNAVCNTKYHNYRPSSFRTVF